MSDVVKINGYKIKDEKAIRSYETIADMKADTKLKEGYHVKTKGFYEANDGGHAEYVIIDDDTLVDDGGLIHVLNNGLRAKLLIGDYVTPEMFGAYGNGIDDDSTSIQNAIDSNANELKFNEKTYLLENNIDLSSKTYSGNNTILKITNTATREHFIRNKNFGDVSKNDVIKINGIKFETDINTSIIGLHSATLLMDNCSFYADNYNTRCLLDLYGNNKNCSITNSNFKIETSDLTKRGTCLEIRGFTDGSSKNIIVSNCILSQNTLDETLWINAGACSIEDVLIENCQINDTGKSANTLWISNTKQSQTEEPLFIKNVEIRNCEINKSIITDRVITIGRSEDSDYTYIDTENIKLNNCNINVTERDSSASSGGTNIINYSKFERDDHELKISNSVITYNGENTITSVLYGTIISENNKINCTNATYAFLRMYKSLNDIITSCKNIARDTFYIDGLEANASSNGFIEAVDYTHFLTSYLKNSKITCVSLINNSGAIRNRIYHFINNTLTYSDSVYNNWSGDSTNKLYLINNYVSRKNSIVNSANCSLYYENNYNDDGLIKGYSGFNSYTLGSIVVGTVLFSNTPTKSIVRKTSEGNTSANWEEV